MQSDLSPGLLFIYVPLIVAVALWAPLYVFLLWDLVMVAFPGDWQIAGVHVDITDLLFAGCVLGLLRPRLAREPRQHRVPYLYLWLALGVLQSVAYYVAPVNQKYFDRPEYLANGQYLISLGAAAYQIYRYCWRPILFYVLAILLLGDRRKLAAGLLGVVCNRLNVLLRGDRRKLEAAVAAMIFAADICAVMSFSQGYAGSEATGPFQTKNQLGGVLIVPSLLALFGVFSARSRWSWRFYVISLLLIGRSLLFAGSRGAFVAVFVGCGIFLGGLLTSTQSRTKAVRFAVAGVLLGFVVIALKPDLLERPTVQQMLTTSAGMKDGNMRWRMEERWPYFWRRALDNFWLGTGTDADPRVDDSMVTPHNGYLGIANISGIPSAALVVLLALLGIRNGARLFRRASDLWQREVGMAIAAAIVGLLIHNIVDETFRQEFALKVFWMLTALSAAVVRRPSAFLLAGVVAASPADRARERAPLQLGAVGVGR